METVKEDRLQKMFIAVNKMFSEYEFDKYMIGNEAKFNKFVMDNINAMCWNMHSWVWSKRPDRKEVITGTIEIPATWFDAFKATYIGKYIWLVKIFKVRYRTVEVKREIELQTLYPTMKILNHEPYLNVVEVNNATKKETL